MKKIMLILGFSVLFTFAPTQKSHAIVWVIIKEAIKKVLREADLIIQQLQNKTIWLQNAQKELENTMSKLKLDEITGWVEKQRKLYDDYYTELKQVKDIIAYYKRVKDITRKQLRLVDAYKNALALFKKDKHFTPAEINYMERVYTGMVDASVKNLDQILLVINSFGTSMSDERRLAIINFAADRIDKNYSDLVEFNNQNKLLSIQRSKDEEEVEVTKALYGLRP